MIEIINVNNYIREHQCVGPVTSPQLFLGKSYTSHPQGLFSEELFGIEGSPERKDSVSWIELNCNVIHPVIYDLLSKRIERKIDELLSGERNFRFDADGFLIEDEENGDIHGMSGIIANIHKWKFREGDDESDRNKLISMLYKNISHDTFFMDKLLVIPPDYRPIHIDEEKGEVRPDEINEIYQKVIILSNSLKSVSGDLFDILSYRMQMLMKELYELDRVKVSKKQGMIRKLMLGKRVDLSARSVISPNPELHLGEVGIPLRIAVQIFIPQMLYALANSPESRSIPDEFYEEIKKFLGKESSLDLDI